MTKFFALATATACMLTLAAPAFAKSAGMKHGGSGPVNSAQAAAKPRLDKNGHVIKPWCKPPVIFGTHCRHVPDPRPR